MRPVPKLSARSRSPDLETVFSIRHIMAAKDRFTRFERKSNLIDNCRRGPVISKSMRIHQNSERKDGITCPLSDANTA
jgi:hypothetical protein